MATSNYNPVSYGVQSQGFKQMHMPCADATSHVNQGDLLYWDATAKIVKPLVDTSATSYCGIALQPSAPSSNIDNTSGVQAQQSLMVGGGSLVVNLLTTSAETYTPNISVYQGADAQTISTVPSTSGVVIGTIVLPPGVVAQSVTGAAGVRVGVLIAPQILLR